MLTGTATNEFDAGRDVAPLVGATHLHLDALVFAEMPEVVGLQEHVRELGVRDAVLALHARAHGFFGNHLIDGEVFADVAQEIEGAHRCGPVGVVDQARRVRTVEIENPLELLLHTRHVVRERLAIEQVPLFAASTWVTDHASGSAGQHHRAMSGQLETAQHHLAEQVAGVQRVGRGIESDVHTDRTRRESRFESRAIGGVVQQTARIEIG